MDSYVLAEAIVKAIDEKKGNKYYVAVKKDGNTVEWYEVDTENWKISVY